MSLQLIHSKIFEVRGQRVMLDFDLAELYEVETKRINEQVRRNKERFPDDFMFKITLKEWKTIQSQIATGSISGNQSQIATGSQKHRGSTPYAFTEHGVTMLASILKSPKARAMNIAIVRAFIALRKIALQKSDLLEILNGLKDRIDEHDLQLKSIYDSIENLLDEKIEHKGWNERERIGFKK